MTTTVEVTIGTESDAPLPAHMFEPSHGGRIRRIAERSGRRRRTKQEAGGVAGDHSRVARPGGSAFALFIRCFASELVEGSLVDTLRLKMILREGVSYNRLALEHAISAGSPTRATSRDLQR